MPRPTLTLAVLLLLPAVSKAQNAEEVIKYYFDAVSNGDFENWTRVKSAYIESTAHYSHEDFQGTTNFVLKKPTVHKLYRVWPDRSRRDLYNNSSLVSSFFRIGKDHFMVMPNMAPMPISSGRYEPYFEFDPVIIRNLLKRAKDLELIGRVDLQAVHCYEIRVRSKEAIWHLYFNADTFLLEFWTHSPDGDKSILTRLYDYRRFGDLLIPMSEIKTRNGVIFFSSQIHRIELNSNIDPKIFVYSTK